MNQMDLFDADATEAEATEEEIFPISSGRVGPICFGSTIASYTLTRDVLADLAGRFDDVEKGAS